MIEYDELIHIMQEYYQDILDEKDINLDHVHDLLKEYFASHDMMSDLEQERLKIIMQNMNDIDLALQQHRLSINQESQQNIQDIENYKKYLRVLSFVSDK